MKKNTEQGKIISQVIEDSDRPLTPLEIHQKAGKIISKIGIATTYRHIKNLCEKKVRLLEWIIQDNRPDMSGLMVMINYILHADPAKLYALEDTTNEIPPAKTPKGFDVQGFEIMLYGICPKCG